MDHNHYEEHYDNRFRKEGKSDRKKAIAKDRSKYKKTDKDKYLKSIEQEKESKLAKQDWLEGRVLAIHPQGVMVDCEGEMYACVLKGLLKKEKTQHKNLVAVGDFVLFEKTFEHEGIIGHIKPRKSFLSRADNLSRRKEQLIAVNIDQVIITVSIVNPPLKSSIIDRYIIATKKGGMEPIIVINKMDLLQNHEMDPILIEVEQEILQEVIRAYAAVSIPVILVSSLEGQGVEELKEKMKGKASVFSGQSGVGKSSLINAITGLDLRVGEIVERTKKGAHTTTTTQLMPLSFGGWCIDTPGIKSFGVWDLDRDELEGYFTEIHELGLNCKFADCTHTIEEQCAIKEALEKGVLSPLRYDSYQALREGLDEKHLRR